jgi:triacylglycerol esterase/lipase EstA (alpha/beta hydrolase family)
MLAKSFLLALSATALAAPVADAEPEVTHEMIKRAGGGLNDYNCVAQPGLDPVILLHGLTAPTTVNWFTKAPILAAEGYCVFSPQYGTKLGVGLGFASMRNSSKEVSGIVDKVLASTGASKVNLVGHSMGTTVSAYYMKFDGGAAKVNKFVGFGANYKGTSEWGLNLLVRTIPGVPETLRLACESCDEFLNPSAFLDDLQRGGVSVPGPDYTTIVSRIDEFVLPYTSGILNEPGVTNIVIQEQCGLIPDTSGHLAQAIDPNVTAWILWALKGKQGPIPRCIPFFVPTKREIE